MGLKECDLIRNLGVSKDSRFIRSEEGSIVGNATSDASFDYSQEGQNFLTKEISSKVYTTGTIYPEK